MRQKLTTTALQLSIILLLLLASTPTGTASNVDDLNKFSKPINLLCSYTGCPFTMDKYIQTIKNIETQPEYQQDTTQPPANENKQTEQINADPYTTNDNTLTPITQTKTTASSKQQSQNNALQTSDTAIYTDSNNGQTINVKTGEIFYIKISLNLAKYPDSAISDGLKIIEYGSDAPKEGLARSLGISPKNLEWKIQAIKPGMQSFKTEGGYSLNVNVAGC